MKLQLVPFLCALIPAIAVHLCYLIAAQQGHVDWCIPYIDSCTSISATGRKPPESYLFRALMIPSAVLMMVYWVLAYHWVRAIYRPASRRATWMLVLGVIACLGMIAYVTVLGEAGKQWATQRRVGTVLFFSFTYLAQLLLFSHLQNIDHLNCPVPAWIGRAGMWLNIAILVTGILTVVLDLSPVDYDVWEDAFEWILTLMLQLNFLIMYFAWRYQGFAMSFHFQENNKT